MRRAILRGTVLLALVLLAPHQPSEARDPKLHGPMVGHVGPDNATIWAYQPRLKEMRLHYRRADLPRRASRSIPFSTDTDGPRMARARITGLSADTEYVYRVTARGRRDARWVGRFRTAPPKGRAGRFTMAVASCMKPEGEQEAWSVLALQKPSFQLLLGDNAYADTTSRSGLWRAHLAMRAKEPFRSVLGRVPTYAVWDDHDFATDNADGTEPGKLESLRTFRELWANPGGGAPGVPGTFFQLSWGDVDFFVLDCRYYRSPNDARNDSRKRMLGDGQFRWLRERLLASKATFKVLANGSTLKGKVDDSWHPFDFARTRLFRLIADNHIEGVLWLSGDLHRSLVGVHPKAETGFYDLIEVISSGISGGPDATFATLTFDTTIPDPSVAIRVLHRSGQVVEQRTFTKAQLRMTGGAGAPR